MLGQAATGPAGAAIVLAPWWVYFLWGVLGGFLVDGLEAAKLLKQDVTHWKTFATPGYITAELLRLLIGGILALGLGLGRQIDAPLGALISGIAAPVIIERYLASPTLPGPGTR